MADPSASSALVLGGCGFVGRNLVQLLVQNAVEYGRLLLQVRSARLSRAKDGSSGRVHETVM